jgi:hypothetical protein
MCKRKFYILNPPTYFSNTQGVIHSFHWHVQNATIPCCSQELLPLPSIIYFFMPLFSNLPHFILPFVSWSTLGLVDSKFIYNNLLGIQFSSILCLCPNQLNLCNPTVSVMVDFQSIAYISLLVKILQFSFSLSYTQSVML